jgi:hypothetical protein
VRYTDRDFFGIATCVMVIGYALFLLISPSGFGKRFPFIILPTENRGVRTALRIVALLVIVLFGYMLNGFIRAAVHYYR